MAAEINTRFFVTCAPNFFSEELKKIYSENESQNSVYEFLKVLDSLVDTLSGNGVELKAVIPLTLGPLSSLPADSVHKLQIQLIVTLELIRASGPEHSLIENFVNKSNKLALKMSLEQDSTAFHSYFFSDLLPRYSSKIPNSTLLQIGSSLELELEISEFLTDLEPSKPKPPKKKSPVRRSPRLNPEHRLKPQTKRTYSRTTRTKKQVNMKTSKTKIILTPEQMQPQISEEAKKLKEINQKYFYEKREGSAKKKAKRDDLEEVEKDENSVLVLETPTKPPREENPAVYPVFRNIFNV